MKTKKLTPRNAAPVQRENTATVSRDGNAIALDIYNGDGQPYFTLTAFYPCAGDDAE